jgi:hypothetical protein
MKALARTLLLWLVLGGIFYLLNTIETDKLPLALAIFGIVALPSLAVGLTAWAVAALPNRILVRVGFWTVTSAAWLALIYFADGRRILPIAAALIALNIALIAVRLRRLPTWRTIGEALSGVAVLALANTAFTLWYDAKTRALVSRAEIRWAEIGLPMAEFEKTLAVTHENAGSEALRQTLRERIGSKFYKDSSRAGEREPDIAPSKAADELVKQANEILHSELPPSDDLDLSSIPATAMEAQAQTLDSDFRRLLAVEPPRWAADPHDGFSLDAPNFLGLRKFTQVAAADALRRISVGDHEGAGRAIAAGMRLREGLRQNPTLVSMMFDVAIEGMLTRKKVHLPASQDGLQTVAADAANLRSYFLRSLQFEAWVQLQIARRGLSDDTMLMLQRPLPNSSSDPLLQKWADRILGAPWFRRVCAISVLNFAEQTAIQKSPATLALPDLGMQLNRAIFAASPSIIGDVGIERSAMRIEATLLLQEQVELIRQARARLATGQPVESHQSVVLPHLRWELIANAEKDTVTTRLVGAPEWIVKNEVTSNEFWMLPIDGSVAWQFRSPARTAGTVEQR